MGNTKPQKQKTRVVPLSMEKDFEKTAAIYVRKSSDGDKREGENMSLAAQKTECENWAKANGFKVVEQYAEALGTSVSSYSNKTAKVLNKALDEMGTKYHTLIVHELSRMTRKSSFSSENVEMINKVVEAGGRLVSLCGMLDTDDLDDMGGRIKLLLGLEFAAEESQKISTRVKRGKAEAARRNQWQGGRIPFGLERAIDEHGSSYLVRNEHQCQIFDEMCDLLLEGMSSHRVAQTMNEREELTSYGHRWDSSKICRLFKLVHWVGHRSFKGELIKDGNGDPVMCDWGQLLDPAKFYAAKQEVTSRGTARRAAAQDRTAKNKAGNSLLSGITFCGGCGSRMIRSDRTKTQTRANGQRKSYRYHRLECKKCEAGVVDADIIDQHVVESALNHLAQLDPASEMMTEVARVWLHQYDVGTIHMRGKLEGEAAQIDDRKNELLELFTDGLINKDQFKDKTTKLDGKLLTIEAEMASMPPYEVDITPLLDLISCSDGESLTGKGSAWAAVELHRQRKILNCIIDEITIDVWDGPKRTGAKANLPNRTTITFNKDTKAIEKSLRADLPTAPQRPIASVKSPFKVTA